MEKRKYSGLQIMLKLVTYVRSLFPIMLLAVILGVTGFLCAIFLTVVAGYGLSQILLVGKVETALLVGLVVMAVMRGVLHYGEQYCNHFIAFRLLALIRHEVFAALRKLCPAKLEGKDKGNLISIITTDIELLEVFYAHTLSPIMIGFLTSLLMVIFIGKQSLLAGAFATLAYVTIGVLLPIWNGKRGADDGLAMRNQFGNLNSFVLESLYGLDETIQYGDGENRRNGLLTESKKMAGFQEKMNHYEAGQRSLTNLLIQFFSWGMLLLMLWQYQIGQVTFTQFLVATLAMMSSFGPVTALSNLSNNLHQTLASGERVLAILEETPEVKEVEDGVDVEFQGMEVKDVSFGYGDTEILSQINVEVEKGSILGIHGASGCGKSTLLKLLMRFFDVEKGSIHMSGEDLRNINTASLRQNQSYVTQDTWLFHDTIENNIKIGNTKASREEVIEAAKKASIHDMIMSLPQGYDTMVEEMGDSLSGGERQRIGIARAFLHESPMMLLDESTSNLDVLNEGIILQSLQREAKDKTVIIVSHRSSTLNIADSVLEM